MNAIAGQRFSLWYPVRNVLGWPLEFTKRRIEVTSTRSIALEPIPLSAFLARPFQRRGIHLIVGRENGQRRQFYQECCRDGGPEAGLQFVLIDDDEPDEMHEPVSRVFAPTIAERQRMLDVLDSLGPPPFGFSRAVRAVPLE